MTTSACPGIDPCAPADEYHRRPSTLLESLLDDELEQVVASLDADGLAAFACVSRHARALASDPRLWHRLLGTELTQSSWSLPDGCVFALEHRDMVRLT